MDVDGNNEGLVVEHASFSCSAPGCKYISKWKANVRRHEKQHISTDAPSQADLSAREFICEHCGSSFTRLSSLNNHRKLKHTETFRFTCERCNRGFIQLWAYRGHLATHDDALKCKCDSCGRTFCYKNNLMTHQKTCKFVATPLSSQSPEYICQICNQNFNTTKNLKDHQKGQHEERRFKCNDCGKSFKWRSSMSYHRRNVNHK